MNQFNRLLTAVFVLATILSSCGTPDCVNGSGNQVSQERSVGDFSRVEISGSLKVVLNQGSLNGLRIIADDNIQDEIESSVHGNTLRIKMGENICDAGKVTVYINSRAYQGLAASGTVEIVSDGKLNVKDFVLDMSGSTRVNLELNAASVKTSSSGVSQFFLKGQAGSHDLRLSGSANIEAFDFVVGKYKIESSGSSNAKINVLNELDINSSGSSDIEYRGNPSHINENKSGISSLRKVN